MERIYFDIDEDIAERAWYNIHFGDYPKMSETNRYKNTCDLAYDLAEKIAKENPDKSEKAYKLAVAYAKKVAKYTNTENSIDTRCPSVMICGPANFPVEKQRKQLAASERNFNDNAKKAQHIFEMLENLEYSQSPILATDDDAIEKLEAKLQEVIAIHDKKLATNKAWRIKDESKRKEELQNLGYSEKVIAEITSGKRQPFPSSSLQGDTAEMKRLKKRIEDIRSLAEEESSKVEENELYCLIKNTEAMRYQFFFDGKPSEEVRKILKRHGFKWAPSNGCWQRQITKNAEFAIKLIKEDLAKLADV